MKRLYSEDELLMISGIQHYYFCKRQWYLIHVEQQWEDNILTVRGDIFHEKVDNPYILESRKNYFVSRSIPLVSYNLGYYGIADAVEFHPDTSGYFIKSKNKYFKVYPIEYKAGRPKKDNCDAVQLCTQAMCLEEMLGVTIAVGYLYYGKTRHREEISLSNELRNEVKELSSDMHKVMNEDKIIVPTYSPKCQRCSLVNLCLPNSQTSYKSVENYIKSLLREKGDRHA